nr:putative ribonuclease H-like domain-containing protein [Tanacetum cinerariifolium]
MDSDIAHMMVASKVSMLKPENGYSLPKTQVVEGDTTLMPITSVEDKAQRRLEVKARSTLMTGIPNEHQLKFNSIKDAKQLMEAIEKRFVNTDNEVSTSGTQVNTANIDNLSDVVICAFLASQPSSPQHVNEDLEQTHPDDLEEIDLRWQMAMLTIRAKRFLKKTGRKLTVNGSVELQEVKIPSTKKAVPVEIHASTNLVSCDGLGGYDWSDQAEEGPNYALMAYTSTSSDSKIVDNCKKGLGYESYNAVPPPYTGNFMPLKPDLSYIGLDEFADKLVVKNCDAKTSETKPKDAKKNNDALIIKEWVSKNVNTARPKVVVNAVKGNKGNPEIDLQDKGVIDSGCSRHMTRNMSYLTDYKEIDGGYVAFGGNLKGGKITSKDTIRTGKLDFKNAYFAEAVNTACYVQNRVLVVKPHNKTPYEHFHGRTPALSFIRPFRCPVTILNTKDLLGKFDGSGPDWIFDIDALTRTMNYKPISSQDDGFQTLCDHGKKADKDPRQESKCQDQEKEDNVNNTNTVNIDGTNRVNIVGAKTNNKLLFDPEMHALEDINTFNFSSNHEDDDEMAGMNNVDTTIQVSPNITKRIHKDHPLDQVIGDLHSTTQTKNMLNNLEEYRKRDIGTKWVFRNKKDKRGIVIRKKARLVAQGYTQEEGIDYDEVFAPVARIKAIRLFLAYASFKDIVVYQMDVISDFLYGKIEKEVYVCQPLGFEDPDFHDKVYKVEKALYGLHQASRAWIASKTEQDGVKNASTPMETQKPLLKDEDGEEVDVHMYRSMIGSLMYLTSLRPDIMFILCACTRYQVNPKVSHLDAMKRIFRASMDRKSITGGITYYCWVDDNAVEGYCQGETITGEVQLQALVDGKKVIITESTVKRDLQLEDAKEVFVSQEVPLKEVSDVDEVNVVSTATTTTATIDDITLAKALMEIKSAKPKAHKEQAPTLIVSSQKPSQVKVQDKGKGKMVEPEPVKKLLKKDQLMFDKELDFKIQAEEVKEEERLLEKQLKKLKMTRTELVVESSKEAEAKVTEGSSKRDGEELEQENAKKQKMKDDKESTKLKQCLEIIQEDGDDVPIDATPLSFKSPTIIDYKIYKEGKKRYFKFLKLMGRIGGIKRLLDDLEVTAVKVCVNASKQNLVLFSDLDMIEDEVDILSPQIMPQVLLSFEEYTLPMIYLKEVEDILGTPIEVETLDQTKLEDIGLNSCNEYIPLSFREVPSFGESKP